ncbi:MAG: FHA domain-containing protein [Clostridiales bacterium]|jgi:ABC-type multidrug transport system ATPase subunit/pSer/pThr/pTyr-binding forkhead associated (FHA) protein|nr:FHA domain-containing protein [Clostridiales bacterium]
MTGFSLTVMVGGKKPYDVDLSEFEEDVVKFGRNARNHIVLDSPIASNFHGELRCEGGAVTVTDKNSTNGIYVNGRRVYEKTRLSPGDVIAFESEQAKQTLKGEYGIVMVLNADQAAGGWSSYKLTDRPVTIGHAPDCDIVLNQVSVSRLHAKIFSVEGKRFIQDSNTTNGVYVNGKRVSRQALADRDVIFIGGAKLVYTAGNHGGHAALYFHLEQPGIPINVKNAGKTVYLKNKPRNILDNISVSLAPNEFVAIIGGSGAGKSTLLNGMCGFSPVTSGRIMFGGEDLYGNYDALKNLIGYVPQQDIVHKDLTLRAMLTFTAEMRMPCDAKAKDRADRVARVIDMVELAGREDTLIKDLSGGQRKRASIAVELISDPNVFFLDEPSSGLDPGTERHLMRTLKNMTQKKKTVIVVTHMTMNISLCDKLIVLGTGGKLCFFGTPDEALAFFNVKDFVDIYDKINTNATQWQLRFANREDAAVLSPEPVGRAERKPQSPAGGRKAKNRNSAARQFSVLCRRYAALVAADRKRLGLLLLQAPLLGLLLSLVAYKTNVIGEITVFKYSQEAKAFLFSLACAAFWLGMLNAVQEICKERDILKRERMTNLKLAPYLFSKLVVLGALCLLQSLLLLAVANAVLGAFPANTLGIPAFAGMFVTTFLSAFSAAALGLFVSGVSPNPDRAMTLAPLILMPQILFSGIAFDLRGFADFLANVINCKWSVVGYCVLANINELPANAESTGTTFENVAYTATRENLFGVWGVLVFIAAVCSLLCVAALRLD